MFYQELLKISSNGAKILADELIDEVDTWLATLPSSLIDKITASRLSTKFGLDYKLSRNILERLCELNVLERVYAIICPKCGHILKVVEEKYLYETIVNTSYCYGCNEEILIDSKDIELRYKLIKKPDDPEKLKRISGNMLGENIIAPQDRINNLLSEDNYNPNMVFYNPTESEYEKLEQLYRGMGEKFQNTTDQGNSLEDFVKYLLSLVRPFTAAGCRTKTNQIDCAVRNMTPIPCTVFNEIGSLFYCECKHEKVGPGNTYFHKLNSILTLSRFDNRERRFGIVFSLEKPASTSITIARETYLGSNIILISFYKDELKKIVYERKNLLDEIEEKIYKVQRGIITDLEAAGLF